jgi:hypothetical protein
MALRFPGDATDFIDSSDDDVNDYLALSCQKITQLCSDAGNYFVENIFTKRKVNGNAWVYRFLTLTFNGVVYNVCGLRSVGKNVKIYTRCAHELNDTATPWLYWPFQVSLEFARIIGRLKFQHQRMLLAA